MAEILNKISPFEEDQKEFALQKGKLSTLPAERIYEPRLKEYYNFRSHARYYKEDSNIHNSHLLAGVRVHILLW
jgi:hypothetical protein